MSFKELFSRSLAADPDRLHFAAHSHHLWPDASYDAHVQAWQDAAALADLKWEKVMSSVWPTAQQEVAAELGTRQPQSVVFAPNTHELFVRLFTALPMQRNIRVLTSDGEFHSARRQLARWQEDGTALVTRVSVEPFDSFSDRFLEAAQRGGHDIVLVSHVMFGSGLVFDQIDQLAALGRPNGPWVVIDGYHAFMAIPTPLGADKEGPRNSNDRAFRPRIAPGQSRRSAGAAAIYLGGGYKYAMAGEGSAFMHVPNEFGLRPWFTGWFAEFEDLCTPSGRVPFPEDARRFLGATFDPSGLYRFIAARAMLRENGLTTQLISDHVNALQRQLLSCIDRTPLATAKLLNPPSDSPHARFLSFRSPLAERWHAALKAQNCVTDVRGDVLRIGFGLYQDNADVERLTGLLEGLA